MKRDKINEFFVSNKQKDSQVLRNNVSIEKKYQFSYDSLSLYSFLFRKKDKSKHFSFLLALPIVAACSRVEDIENFANITQNTDAFSGRDLSKVIEVPYEVVEQGLQYKSTMIYAMGNPYITSDGMNDGFKVDTDGDNIKIEIKALPTAGQIRINNITMDSYVGNYNPQTGVDDNAIANYKVLSIGETLFLSATQLTYLNSLHFVPHSEHAVGTKEFRFVASEFNPSDSGMNIARNTTTFTIRFTPENDQPTITQPGSSSRVKQISVDEGNQTSDVEIARYNIQDPDGDSSFNFKIYYKISDTVGSLANDKFYATHNSGEVIVYLRANQSVDYESQDTNFSTDGLSKKYTLVLVALDETSSGYSNFSDFSNHSKQEITIEVRDVNEAPTDIQFSYFSSVLTKVSSSADVTNYEMNETEASVSLGSFSTTDIDYYDNLLNQHNFRYNISSVNGQSYDSQNHPFTVNELTGELTYKGEVMSSDQSYEIVVQSFDNQPKGTNNNQPYYQGDSKFITKTFSIKVKDVNSNHRFASDSETVFINEGVTDVSYALATDSDGDKIDYYKAGGDDSSFFVVQRDGTLQFSTAPDYENPLDTNNRGNNTYFVEVGASVTGQPDQIKTIIVIVGPVNEAPTLIQLINPSSITEMGKLEGTNASGGRVGILSAVDPDGIDSQTVYHIDYSYGQGDIFTIINNELHVSSTITTKQLSTLNYETLPEDAKHVSVKVIATDVGGLKKEEIFHVSVVDVNESPVAQNYVVSAQTDKPTVIEKQTFMNLFSDPDKMGTQNSQLQQISFVNAQDIQTAIGGSIKIQYRGQYYDINNSVYYNIADIGDMLIQPSKSGFLQLRYQFVDGGGKLSNEAFLEIGTSEIVNNAPVFTQGEGPVTINHAENSTGVLGHFVATDADGDILSYSLSSADDGDLFEITNGGLRFKTSRDYETAGDKDADNTYIVTMNATDSKDVASLHIRVNITDVNEHPSLNALTVSKSYKYNKDGVSVALSDFTNSFQDPDLSNSDNGRLDKIMFTDVSGHVFTLQYKDKQGVLHTVVQNQIYDISVIDHVFLQSGDRIGTQSIKYKLVDGGTPSMITPQEGTLEITIANEAPEFNYLDADGRTTISYNENTATHENLIIRDISATDSENNALTYTIIPFSQDSGSVQESYFTLENGTILMFHNPINYESPALGVVNNEYNVVVQVSDGVSVVKNTITVHIKDVNETPLATQEQVSLSLTYNADGMMFGVGQLTSVFVDPDVGPEIPDNTVNANVSSIKFISLSNQGTLQYKNGFGQNINIVTNKVYSINDIQNFVLNTDVTQSQMNFVYRLLDGGGLETGDVELAMSVGNNVPKFHDSASAFDVQEGATFVSKFRATDDDNHTITYGISDVSDRSDAQYFLMDQTTGELRFNNETDYENPAGNKTQYRFNVTASDGIITTKKTIVVNLRDVNEAPTIGSISSVSREHGDNVDLGKSFLTESYTDPDTGINAEATKVMFTQIPSIGLQINDNNNVLAIAENQEYNLSDIDSIIATNVQPNQSYQLQFVIVDGGGLKSNARMINLNIGNQKNSAPTFNDNNGLDNYVDEGAIFAKVLSASDPDGNTLTYSLVNGSDIQQFTISSSGFLRMEAKDFERPQDSNVDNKYIVTVRVTDTHNQYDEMDVKVVVQNVNDKPFAETGSEVSINYAEKADIKVISWQEFKNGNYFADPDIFANTDKQIGNSFEKMRIENIRIGSGNGENDNGYAIGQLKYFSSSAAAAQNVLANQEIAYNENGYFTYDTSTGTNSLGKYVFYIDYKVYDGYAWSDDSASLQVNVRPNKPPVFSQTGTLQLNADENVLKLNLLHKFVVTDSDYNGLTTKPIITYQVNDARFIVDEQGTLKTNTVFDYETIYQITNGTGKISFVVTATSEGQATDKNVDVYIQDINEAPEKLQNPESKFVDNNTTTNVDKSLFTSAFKDPDIYDSEKQIKKIIFSELSDSQHGELKQVINGTASTVLANVEYSLSDIEYFVYVSTPQSSGQDGQVTFNVIDGNGLSAQQSAVLLFKGNVEDNELPDFIEETPVTRFLAENNSNPYSVGTFKANDANGDTLVYSIIDAYHDYDKFSLDSTTGELIFLHSANFENPMDADRDGIYEVQMIVKDYDNGTERGTSDILTINLNISDVNENPVLPQDSVRALSKKISNEIEISVAEFVSVFDDPDVSDKDFGQVGKIKFADLDDAKSYFYYVLQGSSAETLVAVENEIDLHNIDHFIYKPRSEQKGQDITLTYSLIDKGGLQSVNTAQLKLSFSNEAPVFTSLADISVNEYENTSSSLPLRDNGRLLLLSATDADGDNITYSMTSNTNEASNFTIVTYNGQHYLSSSIRFDHEGQDSYSVGIQASDGTTSTLQNVTITVVDVNERPQLSDLSKKVFEHLPSDFVALDLNSITERFSDDDNSQEDYGQLKKLIFSNFSEAGKLQYKKLGDQSGTWNEIVSGQQYDITDIASLAYRDAVDSGVFYVKMVDGGGLETSDAFRVEVNFLEAPNSSPVFLQNNPTVAVKEGMIQVGTFNATDEDGDTIAYTIDNSFSDGSFFNIDPQTGVLTLKQALDYENPQSALNTNQYEVRIVASDAQGGETRNIVTVYVTDNNEAPSAGQTTIQKTISFAKANNYNALFSSDDLKSSDYFTDPDKQNNEQAQVSKEFKKIGIESLKIKQGALNPNSYVDNQLGSLVAKYGDTEIDITGRGDIIDIVDNMVFYYNESDVKKLSYGNYTFQIEYKVYDGYAWSKDTSLIEVNVQSDTPAKFESQTYSVNENMPVGTVINGILKAYDSDYSADDKRSDISYSLVSGEGFSVTSTGEIRTTQVFNYEDIDNHVVSITVVATSDGVRTTEKIDIKINDINESPEIIGNLQTKEAFVPVSGQEAKHIDINVASFIKEAFSDPDTRSDYGLEKFAFTKLPSEGVLQLVSGNSGDNNPLTIDETMLNQYFVISDMSSIRYTPPLQMPDTNTIEFEVKVRDQLELTSDSVTQTINLIQTIPENEAPVFAKSSYEFTVDESEKPANINVFATDADGDTINYELGEASSGNKDFEKFSLNETGQIVFNAVPDFENPTDSNSNNTYELVVKATDNRGATAQTNVKITINNVNDIPVAGDGNVNTYIDLGKELSPSSDGNLFFNVGDILEKNLFSDTDVFNDPNKNIGKDFEKIKLKSMTFYAENGDEIKDVVPGEILVGHFNDESIPSQNYTSLSGEKDFVVNNKIGMLFRSDPDKYLQAYTVNVKFQVFDGYDWSDNDDIFTFKVKENLAPKIMFNQDVLDTLSIDEKKEDSFIIYNFDAYDPDRSTFDNNGNVVNFDESLVTYSLKDDYNGTFAINDQGFLIVLKPLDHEEKNSYEITLIAQDEAKLKTELSFTVDVSDSNEAPTLKANYQIEDKSVVLSYNNLPSEGGHSIDIDEALKSILTPEEDKEISVGIQELINAYEDSDTGQKGQIKKIYFTNVPDKLLLTYTENDQGTIKRSKEMIVENKGYDVNVLHELKISAPTNSLSSPSGAKKGDTHTITYVVEDADENNPLKAEETFSFDVRIADDGPEFGRLGTVADADGEPVNNVFKKESAYVFMQAENDFLIREANIPLAYDLDGDLVTYSLLAGNDSEYFVVDSTTGFLNFKQSPDYEEKSEYEVIVRATSSNNVGGFDTKTDDLTVRITVSDVNENPVLRNINESELKYDLKTGEAEYASVNALIGKFKDPDDEIGENSLTKIIFSDFLSSPDLGTLKYNQGSETFDIVEGRKYDLSILNQLYFQALQKTGTAIYEYKVVDSDGLISRKPVQLKFDITQGEPTEPTEDLKFTTSTITKEIDENNAFVTSVFVTDSSRDVEYTISNSNEPGNVDASLFKMSINSLEFIEAPDFEQKNDAGADGVYNVVVTARDKETNDVANLIVTVKVNDVDERKTLLLTLDPKHNDAKVMEEVMEETIGTLTFKIADTLETQGITFDIANKDKDRYVIEGNTLKLSSDFAYDFENSKADSVEIIVKKDGAEIFRNEKTIHISDDVTDNNTVFGISSQIIGMAQVNDNKEIGTINLFSIDGINSGQLISNPNFEILGQNTGLRIGTGADSQKIYVDDYEKLNIQNGRVEVRIQGSYVQDGQDGSHSGIIAFHMDESIVTSIGITNDSVYEKTSQGTSTKRTIGELYLTEIDEVTERQKTINTHPTFEILDKSEWGDKQYNEDHLKNFVVDSTTLSVVDQYTLDYESFAKGLAYVILPIKTTIVSDGVSYSFVRDIKINVLDDINDNELTVRFENNVNEIAPTNQDSASRVKIAEIDLFEGAKDLEILALHIGSKSYLNLYEVERNDETGTYSLHLTSLDYEIHDSTSLSDVGQKHTVERLHFTYSVVLPDETTTVKYHYVVDSNINIVNLDEAPRYVTLHSPDETDRYYNPAPNDIKTSSSTYGKFVYIYDTLTSGDSLKLMDITFKETDNQNSEYSIESVRLKQGSLILGEDYRSLFSVSLQTRTIYRDSVELHYTPSSDLKLPFLSYLTSPSLGGDLKKLDLVIKSSSSEGRVTDEYNIEVRLSGIKQLENSSIPYYDTDNAMVTKVVLSDNYDPDFNAKLEMMPNNNNNLYFEKLQDGTIELRIRGSYSDNVKSMKKTFTFRIYDDDNDNNTYDEGEGYFYETHTVNMIEPEILHKADVHLSSIDENSFLTEDNKTLATVVLYAENKNILLNLAMIEHKFIESLVFEKYDAQNALTYIQDSQYSDIINGDYSYAVFDVNFNLDQKFDFEATASYYSSFTSGIVSLELYPTILASNSNKIPLSFNINNVDEKPLMSDFELHNALVYVRNSVKVGENYSFNHTFYYNDPDPSSSNIHHDQEQGYKTSNNVRISSEEQEGLYNLNKYDASFLLQLDDEKAREINYGESDNIKFEIASTKSPAHYDPIEKEVIVYYGMLDMDQLNLNYTSKAYLTKGMNIGTLKALHNAKNVIFSLEDDYSGSFALRDGNLYYEASKTDLFSYTAVVGINGTIEEANGIEKRFYVKEYVTLDIEVDGGVYSLKLHELNSQEELSEYSIPTGGIVAGTQLAKVTFYEGDEEYALSHSFTIQNSELFSVNADGIVSAKTFINFATPQSFLLTVNDGSIEIMQKTFVINFVTASSFEGENNHSDAPVVNIEESDNTQIHTDSSFYNGENASDDTYLDPNDNEDVVIPSWYDVA